MNRSLSTRRSDDDTPSASKIVYSWEGAKFSTDHFDVMSPRELNTLLEEEGWTVTKTERRKVRHPTQDKEVKIDRLILGKAAKTRTVARHQDFDEMGNPTGRALMNPGGGHQLAVGGSYLGQGSDFAGLGLNLASSKMTENAFGMGVDCAKTGGSRDMCPFPPANPIYTKWQDGFSAGEADSMKQESATESPAAVKEAYDLGRAAAKGPEDKEVDCPYAQGSFLFREWLRGFKDNGGKHEEL